MPRFIRPEEIEKATLDFLSKHHPKGTLPIPIEEIVEFSLNLNIVPMPELLSQHSIDGFLSSDCTELYLDETQWEKFPNRARYTMAHEVGHLVLHGHYLRSVEISSIEQWKGLVLGKGDGHAVMETQANMFAGFLLMPTKHLANEFKAAKNTIDKKMFANSNFPEDIVLAPFIAKRMARLFDVSEEAASYRLLNWIKSR